MALAISASNLLPRDVPHKLVVTGKQGWGEEGTGDRVFPTGYVSDEQLSALYSAADLYLAPSLHEGFGIPIIEAFTCGCPVLCSSGGALPEIAGDAARVMSTWDAESWSHAIAELLSDSGKLDSMRERGKRRAADFTWKRSAEIHAKVYQEVACI
jgi:glycosyltransferase involved in cell wall biosynthesis